ncbi:hypothetical protein ZIOFF_039909 [Zingiber officinale]|uniref:Uncharacterized protein n=1 Tax=Zingiber officinale TaxID=94328 RepID=A0A8J5L459_ZINOF|nr:hypothetical protein ZIOFF_039909 [Zingiber officinale]
MDATSGGGAATFLWHNQDDDRGAKVNAGAGEELELKRGELLRAILELESAHAAAQEDLRKMEARSLSLTGLLESAIQERDEARRALLLLHHQVDCLHPPPVSSFLTVDATVTDDIDERESSNPALAELEAAAAKRGLPEKGRLVEAVIEAGPLLQMLLLTGSLPQWRHPPPDLHGVEIPRVVAIAPSSNPEASKLPSPSPASFQHSPPSSSSLRGGNDKFRNFAFSFNNSA